MQTAQQITPDATTTSPDDFIAGILRGYRFRVAQGEADFEAALDVRRRVYRESCGYEVAIPDEYDRRSWLLVAEDTATGQIVGTMRVTPRWAGPLEAEEYFTLPRNLRRSTALEITRFSILPAYRKGKTFLPVVSLGLFKLVCDLGLRMGARYLVVCSKPERMWTYEWLRFKTTGSKARYSKLNDAEHELISLDLQRELSHLEEHPFCAFFKHAGFEEIEMPARIPSPGLPWDDQRDRIAIVA